MDALALAKPVDRDSALAIAENVLAAPERTKELRDFRSWFKTNGDWLVARVNGNA